MNKLTIEQKQEINKWVQEEIDEGNTDVEDTWIIAFSETLGLPYWDVAENLDLYLMELT
tara:strand:- start:275 stop:451 length:177 start_codon:yes stop_codon:yes gene_type:complete